MTEGGRAARPVLSALLPCRAGDTSRAAETLLSLAAQTTSAFEVHVVVVDGSSPETVALNDLVRSFDAGFARRVQVMTLEQGGWEGPLAAGVARSVGTYVTVLYPDDVVFAHWAATFVDNIAAADGRALSCLVAVQAAEEEFGDAGWRVTTVGRPTFPAAMGWDVLDQLASPPVLLNGLALPRSAVQALPPGIPWVAEGWAMRLVTSLTCGILETGEVTCLSRRSGRPRFDPASWEADRQETLDRLDRCGFALGPGTLRSLSSSGSSVRHLQAEVDLLRKQLGAAEEMSRAHAAAASAAQQHVTDLLSSASWRISSPFRTLADLGRQWRRARRRSGSS
jgi:hypothetical protein